MGSGRLGHNARGAFFPIDVLPVWLQHISFLIPITYSLDALRLTMLRGYSVQMAARPILTLSLMVIVLLFFVGASIVIGMLWNKDVWWKAALLFFAIYAVFYTSFFTNGAGLLTGGETINR